MKFINLILLYLVLILTSCSSSRVINQLSNEKLDTLIGEKISVTGTAINAKLGALLTTTNGGTIWINELNEWPEDYYLGGDNGKTVRVTGIVIEKHDLPVFISKKDEPPKSGMPVPEGTGLEEARRRFLLKNATWEIIER